MNLRKFLAAARGSLGCGCSAAAAAGAARARWPSSTSLARRTRPPRSLACKGLCSSALKAPSTSNMRGIRWHTTAGFSHMKEPKAEKRANSISSFVTLGT